MPLTPIRCGNYSNRSRAVKESERTRDRIFPGDHPARGHPPIPSSSMNERHGEPRFNRLPGESGRGEAHGLRGPPDCLEHRERERGHLGNDLQDPSVRAHPHPHRDLRGHLERLHVLRIDGQRSGKKAGRLIGGRGRVTRPSSGTCRRTRRPPPRSALRGSYHQLSWRNCRAPRPPF